jgi:hypothetical protein
MDVKEHIFVELNKKNTIIVPLTQKSTQMKKLVIKNKRK